MAPKEGQIRYEIQGYLCYPLPLRRVLRRESVPQNRGECGNMWGLRWGRAPKYAVSATLLVWLRKVIILENISAREFRYFRQRTQRKFYLV